MRWCTRLWFAILVATLPAFLPGQAGFCLDREPVTPSPTDLMPEAGYERPAKIIVADDRSYAPFAFLNADGDPCGVTIDIWRLWSRKTGIPVEFHLMNWESALAAVRSGEADVVGGLFRTPQREEFFDFTQSFYRISTGVFFHRHIMGIRGLDELTGFLVGVEKGDSAEELIRLNNPLIRLITYEDVDSMVEAALAGKIKVFVADAYVVRFYLAKHGAGNEFLEAFNLVTDNEQYAAVRKGNRQLLNVIQQGFDRISEHEIQEIVDSWTGVPLLSRIPWKSLWTVILLIAAALTIMILWNLQLKRRVTKATRELRKRNADMERSERNYREIFNATSDMIFLHDAEDGRILDVNQTVIEVFGYTKEVILGKTVQQFSVDSPSFNEEEALQKIQQAEKKGGLVFEWLCRRANRETFWAEVSLRSTHIGGENRVLAVSRDISERKRAEHELQERERLLHIQNEILLMLMTSGKLFRGDFMSAIHEITEMCGQMLGVERTSVWLFLNDFETIRCIDLYELIEKRHTSGEELRSADFPNYMRCHQQGQVIMATDVYSDPRAREVPESYYRKHDIRSLIDAPIWVGSKLHGILSFEATGKERVFTAEEERLAAIMATVVSLGFEIAERKQAEEKLMLNEAKFFAIYDQAYHLAGIVDLNGILLDANQAAMAFIDQPKSSVIGKPFWETPWWTYSRELQLQLKSEFQRASVGEYVQFETVHYDSAGRMRYIDFTIKPVRDGTGKIICLIPEGRDITERKQAEKELRLAEFSIENSGISTIWFDRHSRILRVNEAACQSLGYSRDELLTMSVRDFDPDFQTAEQWDAVWEEIKIKGRFLVFETRHRRKDGFVFPVEVLSSYFCYNSMEYIFSFARDVTDRKQAEKALRESENHFRSMMEQSPFSMLVFSPQGDLLQLNDASVRLWGVPKDDAKNYNIISDPQIRDLGFLPLIQRAFAGERINIPAIEYDTKMTFGQGDQKIVQGDLYPLRDENGSIRYIILVHQDITDRVRSEEEREKLQNQLIQAQKMESVGRLAGGVAHDFNNMLGVILGHAELALLRINAEHPIHTDLKEIEKAAQRSADLTRQLLAFARKQTVAPIVLDLNESIESMLKMLRRLIGEDIHLSWLPGSDLGMVIIDPSQIDQIMANLCVNARDAIAGVGKITIETGNVDFDEDYCIDHAGFVSGAYVMLVVSDDGCGMDKEIQEKIFEPFFTTKGMGQGTGLGLSIVFGIVKQNNGFINVYSEPGKGSTFKIYLPRIVDKNVEIHGASGVELPLCGGETVLLVEDEPMILELGQAMLEMLGYRVLSTGAPDEAIRLAEENAGEIHLLITDVVMPDMNGRDLAVQLLIRYPNLKMLFMSGYTANVIAHQGVLDEGVVFLQKPFSMKDLSAKVREALDI